MIQRYGKDTVSTDKEDDKVDGDQDAWNHRPSVSHNSIIHDVCPFLSCQDLQEVHRFKKVHVTLLLHTQPVPETH